LTIGSWSQRRWLSNGGLFNDDQKSRSSFDVSTPVIGGKPWPICVITWCVMWQCTPQSPGLSAVNSIVRVCPVATTVHGEQVPPGGRVSLGWASANRDESVFPQADEFKIDRKPNPHLSFGFGEHLCLGAPHSRLIVRTLLQKCVELVDSLEIVSAEERVEQEHSYARTLGYESLVLRIRPRA
jgi:hypothetical protein